MSRYRQYGSVIGRTTTPSATSATGVYDVSAAAINTQANTWVGTTPVSTLSLPTTQQTGGFVFWFIGGGATNSYEGITSFRNFFEDGIFYQCQPPITNNDLIDGAQFTATVATRNGELVIAYTSEGSGANDGVYMWKKQTGGYQYSLVSSYILGPNSAGQGVAINPAETLVAVSINTGVDATRKIYIFDITGSTLSYVTSFGPSGIISGTLNGLSWSADGAYLAVGLSYAPYLQVYSVSGTTFTALSSPATLPTAQVLSVQFSPSGNYLAVALHAFGVHLYSVSGSTVTYLSTSGGDNNNYRSLSWASSTLLVATVGSTGTYRPRFFTRTGNTISSQFENASMAANALTATFSPDGQYLFISGSGGAYSLSTNPIYRMSGSDIVQQVYATDRIAYPKAFAWFNR